MNINRFYHPAGKSRCRNRQLNRRLFPRPQLVGPNQTCSGASGRIHFRDEQIGSAGIFHDERVNHWSTGGNSAEIPLMLRCKNDRFSATHYRKQQRKQRDAAISSDHCCPHKKRALLPLPVAMPFQLLTYSFCGHPDPWNPPFRKAVRVSAG